MFRGVGAQLNLHIWKPLAAFGSSAVPKTKKKKKNVGLIEELGGISLSHSLPPVTEAPVGFFFFCPSANETLLRACIFCWQSNKADAFPTELPRQRASGKEKSLRTSPLSPPPFKKRLCSADGPQKAEGTSLSTHLIVVPAGMGVATVTAARILKGQLSGQSGEEAQLEMDKFPFVSLAKVCPAGSPHRPKAPQRPPKMLRGGQWAEPPQRSQTFWVPEHQPRVRTSS